MITRLEYNKIMLGIQLPSAVIGTSQHRAGPFAVGTDRSAFDNYWIIRTENKAKYRYADHKIEFDGVIGFKGVRLGDDDSINDALTKRILCVEILNQNATTRPVGAAQTARILAQFDWLIRWRKGQSIDFMSDLTLEEFEQYKTDASLTDNTHLVPLANRLDELLADPDYSLPLYAHGKKLRLNWEVFAATLGVNRWALGRSRSFINAFENKVPDFLIKASVGDKVELYPHGAEPEDAKPMVQFANSRMMIWDVLDRLSTKGLLSHDPLQFRVPPTPKVASESHTSSILPHDLFRILQVAARWILIYSDYIVQVLNAQSELTTHHSRVPVKIRLKLMEALESHRPDGLPPLHLVSTVDFPAPHGSIPLQKAISYLYVACAVVIGILGGRRRNEVASLQLDCLDRGSQPKLSIYIEKTLRDVDAIPIPEIGCNAVELLERLSLVAREESQEPWLFQFSTTFADGRSIQVETDFANRLNEFFVAAGLEPPSGKTEWDVNYHMFRKGFVISHYHGNLWGGFDSTNRMLRHSSANMTRLYMDDEEIGALSWIRNEVLRLTKITLSSLHPAQRQYLLDAKKTLKDHNERRKIWNEGRQEFFVGKMMETFDGTERPIGKGAARMLTTLANMELKAHARIHFASVPTNSDLGTRTRVLEQVKIAAVDHFMEPVPGGFFYCLFQRGDSQHASLANCLKDREMSRKPWRDFEETRVDTRPDYAFSGLYPCLNCDLCAVFNANQAALKEAALAMKVRTHQSGSPALVASAEKYVDDIFNLITEAERAVDGKQRPE